MDLNGNIKNKLMKAKLKQITEVPQTLDSPEPTIHEKYAHWITQAQNGYITGLNYEGLMEILRWCEKKIGTQLSLNMQCNTCIMDLIKLFNNLNH